MNQKKTGMLLLLSSFSYGIDDATLQSIESFWIWVALFALGLIGVLILYIASLQTRKMEKMHEEIFERQLEMEKNQALLLSNMSENIHSMVTKALKKEVEKGVGRETPKGRAVHEAASQSFEGIDIEERLLTVTNDLIAFLRLKSGKVEIINETFNLNNVLNEVSGYICHRYRGKKVDLIFDINNNVPRLLVGDSLHLGQILNSILESMMERIEDAELRLEISMFNTFEEHIELEFHFQDTGNGMTDRELSALFNPYYDEERNSYHGLGLYVSNELVKMMKGTLSAESQQGKGSTFSLSLPLEIFDRENRRKYRLPSKVLTAKKVLIVDNNYHSALAVKKTFAYFKHEVKVLSKELFLQNMPSFALYDIVVLNEEFFSPRLLEYLKKVKSEKETLKVIALDSLLNRNRASLKDPLIDVYLYTPLNQERIFEMIVGMYDLNVERIEAEHEGNTDRLKVTKSQIHETKGITRQNFTDFAGKHILIVEDNVINQKVLASLLGPAGLEVSIANNGQEAVDMVKKGTHTFDLVLMDINMPILDGYDATEMIRMDPDYDTLPIVAFTALVLESEIEKMFRCGINAFLPKPLNIGKLYTALEMFLVKEESRTDRETAEEAAVTEEEAVSLRGLDIEQGIAHANHSKVLYMEILSEFMEAYGKSDMLFKKLVQEHRYEQIRMLCIDMRGLAGTIGAYDMLEVVNKIHHAILYKNQARLPDFIGRYHSEITKLNKSIETYLSLSGYKAA